MNKSLIAYVELNITAQDPQKGQAPLESHIKKQGSANACGTTFFCEKAFSRPLQKGSWSVRLF